MIIEYLSIVIGVTNMFMFLVLGFRLHLLKILLQTFDQLHTIALQTLLDYHKITPQEFHSLMVKHLGISET